ncbi:hypothetical protein BJF93_13325 [Xaviernesmea oryzae]|uniref:Uncharacterized protein n=1 Tax=Xaviernesmea oryzae TaxID=464029 RepID=A0A1Q9AQZ9_9HYPH|nr:hypothetical protein [Xaviernesmea oryzae]OLP57828.1 hypothetical protein BJF93_13325 [Xaviernesmea oryzae]SEL35162.1 hypothetical protein SAMN04487976_107201 [Xaviernesmea oryzae]
MAFLSNLTRPKGDPKILSTGPTAQTGAERLAKGLGWFSIGLGLTELFAARRLSRGLGLYGHAPLIRAVGLREIFSGMMTLSTEKEMGVKSRVAGDGLDIAVLMAALRPDNYRRGNAAAALAMVVGITLVDVMVAKALASERARPSGRGRDYGDRSGFPKGIEAARNVSRDKKAGATQPTSPSLAASPAPAGSLG